MHLEAHTGTPRQKDIKLYYRRQKGAEYAYTRIYAHRHIHTLRIHAHTHTPASAYTHARYIIMHAYTHTPADAFPRCVCCLALDIAIIYT